MFFNIILIIIGFIFLIKGADFLVKSAISIAKKFGLSEMLIGLTILAVGTSLPEIFITITSSAEGHSDLIIGNAIGSSICNFLFVIGLTSLISPVKFDKRIINIHLPIGICAMLLLLFLGNTHSLGDAQVITRGQGLILILCTVAYIIYTIYEEKKIKNKAIDEETIKEVESKEIVSNWKIFIYMVLGLIGLNLGADFVVDSSTYIARAIGLTEGFIGMTIIAGGTALPEIITGIISAKRNETDLLLGNISGSNIINLCLLVGIGALINPLTFSINFNFSILLLIAVTIVLLLIAIINKKSELNRRRGLVLIVLYFVYIFMMV